MLSVLATIALIAAISAGPPGHLPVSTDSLQVNELSPSCARMKDPAKVKSIIEKIIDDGPDNLQIIVDFDLTLTKHHLDGKNHPTSFSLFNLCKGIPPHVHKENNKNIKTYATIQNDPNMDKSEKIPYMVEWYKKTSALYSGFKFSKNDIKAVVDTARIELRDGTSELVSLTKDHNVPVLVYSAGVGDVVQAVLERFQLVLPNVRVISNFLQFKGDGMVHGFADNAIHPLNKNGGAASQTPFFEEMLKRRNVLVMGDSVGDDQMADGLQNTDVVLKIGFIWNRADLIPYFMDHFDIVLIDDQTMNIPLSIVKDCVEHSGKSDLQPECLWWIMSCFCKT